MSRITAMLHRWDIAGFVIQSGLCLFAFSLPLSVSWANISWGVILLGLVLWVRKDGWQGLSRWTLGLERQWFFYLMTAVLVSLFGLDLSVSFTHIRFDFHKVWVFFLLSLAILVQPTPQALRFLQLGFVLAACMGIYQVLGQYFSVVGETVQQWAAACSVSSQWLKPARRAHGTVHPVTYGEMMALAGIGTAAFFVKPKLLEIRFSRLSLGIVFVVVCAGLILSQTRAAWAGAILGFAVLLYFRKDLLYLFIPGACVLAAGMALFSYFGDINLSPRVIRIFNLEDDMRRLEMWRIAWDAFVDHPLLGVGVSNYRTVFPYYHPNLIIGREEGGSAHNLYLHHMAERGSIGLMALLYLFGSLLQRSWQRCQENPTPLNLWALAGFVCFLVMNLTEIAFHAEVVWMFILFIYVWAERVHG